MHGYTYPNESGYNAVHLALEFPMQPKILHIGYPALVSYIFHLLALIYVRDAFFLPVWHELTW